MGRTKSAKCYYGLTDINHAIARRDHPSANMESGMRAKRGSRRTGGQIQVKDGTVLPRNVSSGGDLGPGGKVCYIEGTRQVEWRDQGKLDPKWEGHTGVTEAFENGYYKLADMEDRWSLRNLARDQPTQMLFVGFISL
ncbi:hypothetical protein Tco_0659407 [Tanacetum coccineum]